MGPSHKTLALCALLGIGLLTAACGASSTGTATTPPAASAPAPTTPAASPAASSPVPPASSAPATAALPGVIAECTSPPPYRLSTRPSVIVLACADDGLGVQNLTWTTWAAAAATGEGKLWQKLCQPNCATGKLGYYPVAVMLSSVRTSSQGPWFSRLTVTWEGSRPPGSTPDTFGLPSPSS
jgi:hypothetical protein